MFTLHGSNLEVVFSGGVVGVAVLQLWGVAVQCCSCGSCSAGFVSNVEKNT